MVFRATGEGLIEDDDSIRVSGKVGMKFRF
jgi:hypothetical protein